MTKRYCIFITALFCAFIGVFLVANAVSPDRTFSEVENRNLEQLPAVDFGTPEKLFRDGNFFNGQFMRDFETYTTDQFIGRDAWVDLKARTERALGKKENNNVYFADNDTLITRFDQPAADRVTENLNYVNKFVENVDIPVVFSLIPTQACIWADRLPEGAPNASQTDLMAQAQGVVTGATWADVYTPLMEHKDEDIFYRTDHHWTSLGAYYGYTGLASALVKRGANVHVLMTRNATEFIGPHTFESLTGNRVSVDTFDRNYTFQVEHIALADQADAVLVAPATANVLAKLAHGLADDMLTTTVLACKCPKLIAPAMNTNMCENPVTQDNLDILRRYGWEVIAPASGRLACGAVGAGKMPEPEDLLQHVLRQLACPHDLEGKHVLVTAGPTQESLDPVRYLTNHSTGKMGYALARAAAMRGADVTLIHGETALQPVKFTTDVPVTTAQQMYEAVTSRFDATDVLIMAAAVADYRPAAVALSLIHI